MQFVQDLHRLKTVYDLTVVFHAVKQIRLGDYFQLRSFLIRLSVSTHSHEIQLKNYKVGIDGEDIKIKKKTKLSTTTTKNNKNTTRLVSISLLFFAHLVNNACQNFEPTIFFLLLGRNAAAIFIIIDCGGCAARPLLSH